MNNGFVNNMKTDQTWYMDNNYVNNMEIDQAW